jgi:hypothetical protein
VLEKLKTTQALTLLMGVPINPEFVVNTGDETLGESVIKVIEFFKSKNIVK